ncbi:MAG: hypothetical protein H0Z22_07810 [Thermosipho sp. (in: Bacteria)]|nr:hypothetical protein [Thermosipho sp. (in: thermotogales)]
MKKFVLVFLMFSLVFVLFGCLDMETTWTIKEDNSIVIKTILIPAFGYEDEMNTYFQAFKIGFAPLFKKMVFSKKTVTKDYIDYDVYYLQMREPITIKELQDLDFNISFNGNVFEFEIPKILDSEPYSPDDVVFNLVIEFPKAVDIANSTLIDGKKVTWKITKQMLYTGTLLKAYLK